MYALLVKHADERGDAFAVRDINRRMTWLQLREQVDRIAQELHATGLRAGDRVSVWLPDRVELVAVFLACSRNGYMCNTSLNEHYTVDELARLLARIECRALFAQTGYGAGATDSDALARLGRVASLKALFALQPVDEGFPLAGDARAFPRGVSRLPLPPASTNPDQPIYLAFTSGTTGEPKGVMHSDNTLLANARAISADWGLNERSVILTLSPMSRHIGIVGLLQSLVTGGELVMTDRRSGIAPIDWIEQTGATYVMGVPTHAVDLLRAMEDRGRPGLGLVSVFYMAGSPIPRDVAARLLQLGVMPQNVYGMTENGSHQYTRPRDDTDTITGTCGAACAGYRIRLFRQDDPDVEAGPGEVGEIGGRGGLLMLGYFSDQAATEQAFNADGWFMSGDLGQFDARGNLRVVGRKKDSINRGGHKIQPAPIEALAMRHPNVARASVFGVADTRFGERACLAIVPHGNAPSADAMLEYLGHMGLSRYDMPEYYVWTEAFPAAASGPLLKRELIEWVRIGRLRPAAVRPLSVPAEA